MAGVFRRGIVMGLGAALCLSVAFLTARPVDRTLFNDREIVAAVRQGLKHYSQRIRITFDYDSVILNDLPQVADAWMAAAQEETGVADEGDFLRYHNGGYEAAYTYRQEGDKYAYTVDIFPDYYLYATQAQEAETALARALEELAVPEDATDVQKVKAAYDYLCAHVTYDQVHKKNPYYRLRSTSYGALVNGTATCQGYAVTLYRLLEELGVECRVITGTGYGEVSEEFHAWNIARVDGAWYCLDATWDAGREEPAWFLRGADAFERHIPGEEFTTARFQDDHPLSKTDHTP